MNVEIKTPGSWQRRHCYSATQHRQAGRQKEEEAEAKAEAKAKLWSSCLDVDGTEDWRQLTKYMLAVASKGKSADVNAKRPDGNGYGKLLHILLSPPLSSVLFNRHLN